MPQKLLVARINVKDIGAFTLVGRTNQRGTNRITKHPSLCCLGTDTSSKFGLLLRLKSGNTISTCSIPVRTRSNHRGDVRCWINTLTTVYGTRSRTSIGPADHYASNLSYTSSTAPIEHRPHRAPLPSSTAPIEHRSHRAPLPSNICVLATLCFAASLWRQ